MNKIFLLLLSVLILSACSEEGAFTGNEGGATTKQSPATKVYVQGKLLNDFTSFNYTKATNNTKEAAAYYFIRIDNRIPEMFGQCDASLYFPRNTNKVDGGSVFSPLNTGTIKLDYPYWKTAEPSTHVGQYIYDTTGKKVLETVGTVPTLENIIAANQDASVDFSRIDPSKVKIIWYVSKFTWNRWHVDGVLTLNSTKDVTEVPGIEEDKDLDNSKDEPTINEGENGNIEVDIHQQEHNTWDEIKTSIHVRDLVDQVTVEIPIDKGHITDADDFALRLYDFELESKVFINGTEYTLDSTNPVKVTISHEDDKVIITVQCTDESYLNALRKEYGDGVTVEVHTYPKDLTKAEIWGKVKNSVVKVVPSTYDRLIYKGATSAFFEN